ncbi:unnamed protein product [Symbiodinium natans]|uniref:Ubiquitin-like domain-containing protein n=1 Tax=Symbiodinium natans TaxID=878477 RepID=A0A812V2B0_9DINO|nr:unnamed protein product [Symbiodinium natans]
MAEQVASEVDDGLILLEVGVENACAAASEADVAARIHDAGKLELSETGTEMSPETWRPGHHCPSTFATDGLATNGREEAVAVDELAGELAEELAEEIACCQEHDVSFEAVLLSGRGASITASATATLEDLEETVAGKLGQQPPLRFFLGARELQEVTKARSLAGETIQVTSDHTNPIVLRRLVYKERGKKMLRQGEDGHVLFYEMSDFGALYCRFRRAALEAI